MRTTILTFILCFLNISTHMAQGKLLLIGGGSEQIGGWSNAPYQWAVNQSGNKKVAIISTVSETNFIPNYFVSLGAIEATNITIPNALAANSSNMYATLMAYDVFFFKGGDQFKYYDFFKNSSVQTAIEDKYNQGGVIAGTSAGMAILSEVMFTAQNGSIYPPDGLESINSTYFALANDFLTGLQTDVIFDTHFTERGRMGRLFALMAKWQQLEGETLQGIGVDDATALCIDANKIATCYGTGSVSLYKAGQDFTFENDKPQAANLQLIQLLHGFSYNLTNQTWVNTPVQDITPTLLKEQGNYTVLLGGGTLLSSNSQLLDYLIEDTGQNDDAVVLISKNTSLLSSLKEALIAEGVPADSLIELIPNAENNQAFQSTLRNRIRRAKKAVFFQNDLSVLSDFLQNGQTGQLLATHLKRDGMITAFLGDDAKMAGKTWVVNNFGDPFHAYYGELEFRPGLSLLATTVIVPNAFNPNQNQFYENNTASVLYSMMAQKLAFGLYLNSGSYLVFEQLEGENTLSSFGQYSSILLHNEGTKGAFATQTVNTAGDIRQSVAYKNLKGYLLYKTQKANLGTPQAQNNPPYEFEMEAPTALGDEQIDSLKIYPNPSTHLVKIIFPKQSFTVSILDRWGRKIGNAQEVYEEAEISLKNYPAGIYHLQIDTDTGNTPILRKIVKED